MGFFNRRSKPVDANTANATGNERHYRSSIMSNNERRHKSGGGVAYGDGALNRRPKFGQWIKVSWPDILTMIIMGIIGLGVSANQLSAVTARVD